MPEKNAPEIIVKIKDDDSDLIKLEDRLQRIANFMKQMGLIEEDKIATSSWLSSIKFAADEGARLGTTLLTVTLFDGNINSNVFYSWMTQCLIPVLPQKSVLFMDNVSFHKREDIIQAIEKAGHQVEFLPPYSPDLNPIEHKWAQAKRKKKEIGCDIDTLFSVYM